ncbi:MAG: hypothetical protein OEW39_10135 [Deltaproteobacteria bacterium]|nr:hypothetical protein [Deltaproteobacteria bacterium]
MRKILLALLLLLTLSGGAIVGARILDIPLPGRKLNSLLHIYGGLFFLVIFPLYAWDHVRANRHWLSRIAGVTLSGSLQLVSALVLLLTGLILLLYGEHAWDASRTLHDWLTPILAFSLALHYLSPKRQKP